MNTPIDQIDTNAEGNQMGLCAQTNIMWEKLTVDENLTYIGRIKGLTEQQISDQKNLLIQTLELEPYQDKLAMDLSGGNKRKLCCAISLMANPKVEFLDEPTSGVDPIARRSLFRLLKNLKQSSIMLTTHRMDEAEGLCDTIAIMINGKFVCYGSPGHLKQKYGQGYEILIRVTQEQRENAIRDFLYNLPFCKMLPSPNVVNENTHLQEISYNVDLNSFGVNTNDQIRRLSMLFMQMNKMQDEKKVHDFSITRSSLEQVFIHFARFQLNPGMTFEQIGLNINN